MRLPYLNVTTKYEQVLDVFLGYNHNLKINEGEWADMVNISPRAFPTFAPRERRGMVKQLVSPQGMIARDALVWVDGNTLYINDYPVTGLVLSTSESMQPKQLVSMGAYVVILPDKKYVNTADLSEYGSIEASYTFEGDVSYTPARVDGTEIDLDGVPATVEPPVDPINGDYWIYIGGETDVLRQFSSLSDEWVDIPSTYTRISLPGIGTHFKQYDGVEISGCAFAGTDISMQKQLDALNGNKILYAVNDNSIIVVGLINRVHTQEAVTIIVKRTMPDMDYVIESENRLWGCKYGVVGGETVNEIYACVQGDFKNWKRYMGIATDAYAVSLGTDGAFTGAITYQGYPTFFKENNMHRVRGSMPSQYRVDTMACRGVQDGSHMSLAIVNELLFYKGRTDIMCFDGSVPYSVSDALGGVTYRDAVSGAFKDRYYISMRAGNDWSLFLYDNAKRLWYREDDVRAMCFAQLDDELYYIDTDSKQVLACFGKSGTLEVPVEFSAQSGIMGYVQKDHKYVSRMNIRARAELNAVLDVHLRYDSAGDWELAGRIIGTDRVGTVLMPIRPHRCDHYEMKVSGEGDIRILSIAKVLEIGGDGR